MEIEVGEYVRTNNGVIGKLIRIERDDIDISLKWYVFYDGKNERYINKPYITNHSFNIIVLIEVGDYVNGYKVLEVMEDLDTGELNLEMESNCPTPNCNCQLYNKDIKTIVTHEQFASIEYKVEEEK